nr:hypothetical protein [Tanacetum cinerariifolium]
MSWYNHPGCSCCGGSFNGGNCPNCSSVGSRNEFVYDPNPYSYNETPNFYNQPSQHQYKTNYCGFCGNDAHYGYDLSTVEPNFYEPNNCYNSNSFGFDQSQPPQFLVIYQPPQATSMEILQDRENVINSVQTFLRKFNRYSFSEMSKVLLLAWGRVSKINAFRNKQYKPENIQELFRKLFNDVQNIHEELAEYIITPSWNRPAFYNNDEDDNEEYTIAITPVLPTKEPDNSLSMGDELLSTILETESNEVIKSSVEDLVPIPSEFEGIPDNMCDVPFRDNSPPLDILKDQFEDFSYSNDDSTLIDDDSFSIDDIDYVEASPPHSELISLKEVKDFHLEDGELEDDVLREKISKINLLIAKIEALNANPTPSFDFVLKSPILVEDEKNSSRTTIHADISLPDLECFYFKSEPDLGDLTSIIDLGIRENVSSTTNVNLPFENDQSSLFTYVVWIFLPFLTYPVAPPYLLPSGNEDTIFDLGISIYHSFMPGVSHRSGTFMKFNVYPNHLNESPMEILSSTCFPKDQRIRGLPRILKTRTHGFVLRSLDLHILSFI